MYINLLFEANLQIILFKHSVKPIFIVNYLSQPKQTAVQVRHHNTFTALHDSYIHTKSVKSSE